MEIIKNSCILEEDINKCPNWDKHKKACLINNTVCGMYDKNPKGYYKREPRWYEKYYSKDSFI